MTVRHILGILVLMEFLQEPTMLKNFTHAEHLADLELTLFY